MLRCTVDIGCRAVSETFRPLAVQTSAGDRRRSFRGGNDDDVVLVVAGGAVERTAAGDECESWWSGSAEELGRELVLRDLLPSGDDEVAWTSPLVVDGDLVAGRELPEVPEDAGSAVAVDVADEYGRPASPGLGPSRYQPTRSMFGISRLLVSGSTPTATIGASTPILGISIRMGSAGIGTVVAIGTVAGTEASDGSFAGIAAPAVVVGAIVPEVLTRGERGERRISAAAMAIATMTLHAPTAIASRGLISLSTRGGGT